MVMTAKCLRSYVYLYTYRAISTRTLFLIPLIINLSGRSYGVCPTAQSAEAS